MLFAFDTNRRIFGHLEPSIWVPESKIICVWIVWMFSRTLIIENINLIMVLVLMFAKACQRQPECELITYWYLNRYTWYQH
jgi:hypothetical protein